VERVDAAVSADPARDRLVPDFAVLAFAVLAFDALAFDALAFDVLAFDVLAFDVLAFDVAIPVIFTWVYFWRWPRRRR
jgi:hypothetical protein